MIVNKPAGDWIQGYKLRDYIEILLPEPKKGEILSSYVWHEFLSFNDTMELDKEQLKYLIIEVKRIIDFDYLPNDYDLRKKADDYLFYLEELY